MLSICTSCTSCWARHVTMFLHTMQFQQHTEVHAYPPSIPSMSCNCTHPCTSTQACSRHTHGAHNHIIYPPFCCCLLTTCYYSFPNNYNITTSQQIPVCTCLKYALTYLLVHWDHIAASQQTASLQHYCGYTKKNSPEERILAMVVTVS